MPRRTVIRVLNSVGHTSAPLNQFALYRARHYPDEHNHVVSLVEPTQDITDYCAAQSLAGGLELHHGKGHVPRFLRVLQALVDRTRAQGPVVLHLHHPASGSLVQSLRPLVAGRVPIVYTVHNAFHTPKNRMLTRLNFLLADHVTFVGEASYEAFPRALTRRKRAASVIPNGVDLARIDRVLGQLKAQPATLERGASFKLITVGRMVDAKNQEFLLELLSKLPPRVTLTLVGDGAKADALKAYAEKLGVSERAHFTGMIPRDQVFAQMQQADLFVSSSFWEGLPVAVLEAMASRLPVLLSDIAPHQELAYRAPRLGILPLAVDRWAETINTLAEAPPERRLVAAASNRTAVESHFSLATMQASYTRVYEQLLAGRSGPST